MYTVSNIEKKNQATCRYIHIINAIELRHNIAATISPPQPPHDVFLKTVNSEEG